MTTFAIILATSEGPFEVPTAVLEHEGGRTFLRSIALNFGRSGCRVLGVIGGRDAELVREHHPEMELVETPEGRTDLLSTVRAGIRAALDEGADQVLLHPVDMPAVRTTTLKALVKAIGEDLGLRPEFENAAGFPILLSRQLAEQFLAQQDAQDFNTALLPLNVRRQPTRDPGVVVRFTSPDIYERLLGSAPHAAPLPRRRGRNTEEAEHAT